MMLNHQKWNSHFKNWNEQTVLYTHRTISQSQATGQKATVPYSTLYCMCRGNKY